MKRWFNDFVHNAIVHPLMPFMSVKLSNRFHDWHAAKVFGLNKYDELALENRKP